MVESVEVSAGIVCPACHFGCKLVKYQCGRGKEFYELAAAGGEVPERRGPMMTPSEKAKRGDAGFPLDERLTRGLSITGRVMERINSENCGNKAVDIVSHAQSFMSLPILQKRAIMTSEQLQPVLDEACEAGWMVVEEEEHSGTVARLTEAGQAQAVQWRKDRAERMSEFLSPLTEEEREQLESLISKLLPTPGPRPAQKGRPR